MINIIMQSPNEEHHEQQGNTKSKAKAERRKYRQKSITNEIAEAEPKHGQEHRPKPKAEHRTNRKISKKSPSEKLKKSPSIIPVAKWSCFLRKVPDPLKRKVTPIKQTLFPEMQIQI